MKLLFNMYLLGSFIVAVLTIVSVAKEVKNYGISEESDKLENILKFVNLATMAFPISFLFIGIFGVISKFTNNIYMFTRERV